MKLFKVGVMVLTVLAAQSVMAGGTTKPCPTNCKCDSAGNVISTNTNTNINNVNSGNSTTNKNTYNTSNSNNTDKSVHQNTSSNATIGNTSATGGTVKDSGNSTAKQQQAQTQQQSQAIKNSGNSSLTDVGNASATADNSGNNVGAGNITNVDVEGSSTVYRAARIPVSSAYAPALTSGFDTCLGSLSGGAQTMPVGISFGGTKEDKNCVFIKDVHLLKEFNERVACIYMRKHDKEIDQAYTDAGVDCPPMVVIVSPEPLDTSKFMTREEYMEREKRIVQHTLRK